MKVYVRFPNADGYCAMVGMNNLWIVEDARIKSHSGIRKRLNDIMVKYHKGWVGKPYKVFDKDDNLLFTGKLTHNVVKDTIQRIP